MTLQAALHDAHSTWRAPNEQGAGPGLAGRAFVVGQGDNGVIKSARPLRNNNKNNNMQRTAVAFQALTAQRKRLTLDFATLPK